MKCNAPQTACAPGHYPDTAFLRESCGSRPLVPQPDNSTCFRCSQYPAGGGEWVSTPPECPSGWNTVCQPGVLPVCVELACPAWSRKEYSQDGKCYRCVSTQRPSQQSSDAVLKSSGPAVLMGNDGRWYAPDGLGGCIVWNGANWCRP